MVIDPGNNVNLHSSTSARARQTVPGKSAGEVNDKQENQNSSADSVSLSSQGQAIAKIEANLVNSSEVDEAKVAQIKAAITSGRYNIDSGAIAEKMMNQDGLF
ncbi:hypothetical protein TDB9533_02139 [Thalassocella blandensis]|nr:hypothetical protein TDB9533_02139 [Thalassocella blandensis]